MPVGVYKKTLQHRINQSNSKRKSKNLEDYLFKNIKFSDKCWLWKGFINDSGYGVICNIGKDERVHRLIYKIFGYSVKKSKILHHLCEVRNCVNPGHLMALTQNKHALIGNSMGAVNLTKTHCKRGHEFNKENTYIEPCGYRRCNACCKQYNKRRIDEKKLQSSK